MSNKNKGTMYWIVTTGQGMLPAGKKVGNVEASSVSDAKQRIAQQVGDIRASRWDYIKQED